MPANTVAVSAPGILIVDDDASNRDTIRLLLEELPYPVGEAATSAQTLHALRTTRTSLIVVFDILLPGVEDGAAVLGAICADKRLRRRAAVVAMTASPNLVTPAVHELLRQLGAPLIVKPFDIDDLLHEVAAAADSLCL